MRIRRVTAVSFGPLAGETLELADGLTVVFGPNESGKSSWHAAIYAALCGLRRGRGRTGDDERVFSDRHRPWDRQQEWLVGAELLLDDGRRVELRQDLHGRVACDAVDVQLGRDVSAEIIRDGTPDASRWLGLDRESFLATAWIRQAQVLDVLARAHGLREHLQRAASNAGVADHTATSAIARIDEFRASTVGGAQRRPLRRAQERAVSARRALDAARAQHAEHGRRFEIASALRAEADRADREVLRHEAGAALLAARRMRLQADEAVELDSRIQARRPDQAGAREAMAMEVDAVLALWASLGIARDAPPSDAVAAPDSAIPSQRGADQTHEPPQLTDEHLHQLALDLEARRPSDATLEARLAEARAGLRASRRARARRAWLVGCGLAAALAAATLAAATVAGTALVSPTGGAYLLGVALLCGAALLATLAAARSRRRGADVASARERLGLVEVDAAALRRASQEWERRRTAALARCGSAGLPADPGVLREVARGLTRGEAYSTVFRQQAVAAADRLLAVASAVGVDATTAPEAADDLERWRRSALALRTQTIAESARLETLVGTGSTAQLCQQADAAEQRARLLLLELGDAEPENLVALGEGRLSELRAVARAAAEAASAAERAMAEHASSLTPLAEAEEELTRADAELERLRELEATLERTRNFLAVARERAYRTIAPVLAATVRPWLADATAGRYAEVSVDPETLLVRVRAPEGRWREADRLSYGTAEQIYLMLRVALADHLVRPGTVSPLLLDDVTVHADSERVVRILELLLRIAETRQVVLFTARGEVRQWALDHLPGPPHALKQLDAVATA